MKITNSHGEAGGFFVSLSDVLFALMSIFVFLMILIATQIQEQSVSPIDVAELESQLSASREEANSLRAAHAEILKKVQTPLPPRADVLATKPIDVVFVVDGSGSMSEAMARLKLDVTFIAQQIPRYCSRLRIGIVVYRASMETFELQQIRLPAEDAGASLEKVKAFVERLNVVNGAVDTAGGMRAGLRMLAANAGSNTQCAYVVIGDVGPYEMANHREAGEVQVENGLVSEVGDKCNAIKGLSVIMIMPDTGAPNASGPYQPHTELLWNRMASAAGPDRGSFERSTGSMLGKILIAVLDPRKN